MNQSIQIEAHKEDGSLPRNNQLIYSGRVKRIHSGWYTVWFNGVNLDCSTVTRAKRNRLGKINPK